MVVRPFADVPRQIVKPGGLGRIPPDRCQSDIAVKVVWDKNSVTPLAASSAMLQAPLDDRVTPQKLVCCPFRPCASHSHSASVGNRPVGRCAEAVKLRSKR